MVDNVLVGTLPGPTRLRSLLSPPSNYPVIPLVFFVNLLFSPSLRWSFRGRVLDAGASVDCAQVHITPWCTIAPTTLAISLYIHTPKRTRRHICTVYHQAFPDNTYLPTYPSLTNDFHARTALIPFFPIVHLHPFWLVSLLRILSSKSLLLFDHHSVFLIMQW